jgi:hypothetical protein
MFSENKATIQPRLPSNTLNSHSNTPVFIPILGSLSEILHEFLDGLQDCLPSRASVRNEQRLFYS